MSPAMDYLKHQSRKELQKMAKEWGIKANLRSDDIRNKLVAEGFTPPSSGGTSSGDQPENCAPESPRTESVGTRTDSAGNKIRRRRAALHVRNEADGVVPNEGSRKEHHLATQQRSGASKPHKEVASVCKNTPGVSRASAPLLYAGLPLRLSAQLAQALIITIAGTATQFYTPCATATTDFFESPADSRGPSPALYPTPPAAPAHLKQTPQKLTKAAATPSKPRRLASMPSKSSSIEMHSSKRSTPAHSSRDQSDKTSPTIPLADITAGAQPLGSPAQCIAEIPSTAAALQRLKQTRSHGRVRSVPAPPPHLKHQSSSASPPFDPVASLSTAATTISGKSRPRTASASKASKLTPAKAAQRPSLALSPVPQHLSKRSDRSRATGAPADYHTILSARSKRAPSVSGHRAIAAEHVAATATAAGHTMAAAAAAAMHAAAEYSIQTAAIQQQIHHITRGSRAAIPNQGADTPSMTAERSVPHAGTRSLCTHRNLQRAESAPTNVSRTIRTPTAASSVEIICISDETPSPANPNAASHTPRSDRKTSARSVHRAQECTAVRCPMPIIEEPISPSPPERCASPFTLVSPTLPSQPIGEAHDGTCPRGMAAVAPARSSVRVQRSEDQHLPPARPPTAPSGAKSRRTATKDSVASIAETVSGSSSVSHPDAQRAVVQPAGPSSQMRSRDRTPSKTPARRRNSPSQIVHAIHNAGQARTRPTQAGTDVSDPRQCGQPHAALAPRHTAAVDQKQVELDSALRQLQPPQFSSDGDHMSASDDDDVDTDLQRRRQQAAGGFGGGASSGRGVRLQRSVSAGVECRSRVWIIPDVRVSERQRSNTAVAGLQGRRPVSGDAVSATRRTSLQELLQASPLVLRRRSLRRQETVEWMQERSRELGVLEESMLVLTLGGRSSSVMSAEPSFRGSGGRLRTSGSSQMDSAGPSTSVDQFLLAERAAGVVSSVSKGRAERGGREGGAAVQQRGRTGTGQPRRKVSRSPVPWSSARSLSPAPTKRKDALAGQGPVSAQPRLGASKGGGSSMQRNTSLNSSSSGSSLAGGDGASAAASSRHRAGDPGGPASSQGPAGKSGSKGYGPSPYMASPMAQKTQARGKSTVGALRTPSVQPRVAMMACQRKRA